QCPVLVIGSETCLTSPPLANHIAGLAWANRGNSDPRFERQFVPLRAVIRTIRPWIGHNQTRPIPAQFGGAIGCGEVREFGRLRTWLLEPDLSFDNRLRNLG